MSRSRSIARSALWNLIGQASPLVVAIFAIPALIHGLGTERFGALAIVWTLIGYLGLFDLGVGRALTRAVAERRALGQHERLAADAWTALLLTMALGLVAALAGATLAGPLVERVLRTSPDLAGEMRRSIVVLAWAMPFVLGTSALRGILEAHHRFGMANAIRVPLGVYQFLAPLVALGWTRDLAAIVAVLAIGRVVAWVAHLACALVVMPELRRRVALAPAHAGALVREGGWMTVTNIVGPVLVHLDRFLLGALASMRAVAHYATPFELVTRLLVIPGALSGVLFPSFAADRAARPQQARALYARGSAAILVLVFPPALLLSAFAPELLRAWVGTDFAVPGTAVLRWLTVGVVVNSLAHVPFALLQAAGESRSVAILHLVETPLYAAGAWWAIGLGGAHGAAIAWTTRCALDALALFVLARARVDAAAGQGPPARALAAALVALLAVDFVPGLGARAALAAVALATFVPAAWRWLLGDAERDRIRAWLTLGARS